MKSGPAPTTTTSSPTSRDLARLRMARAIARNDVVAIDRARRTLLRAAFRKELACTVTCASPYLVSLLADNGKTLGDVVADIRPVKGWPRRPRLEVNRFRFPRKMADMWLRALPLAEIFHGCDIEAAAGCHAWLHVFGHSLEVELVIDETRIETRFGILRIEPRGRLPETLAIASVGRPIGEVVDHPSFAGRPWIVTGVEDRSVDEPQTLLVATGSVPFRMPWAMERGGVTGRG